MVWKRVSRQVKQSDLSPSVISGSLKPMSRVFLGNATFPSPSCQFTAEFPRSVSTVACVAFSIQFDMIDTLVSVSVGISGHVD